MVQVKPTLQEEALRLHTTIHRNMKQRGLGTHEAIFQFWWIEGKGQGSSINQIKMMQNRYEINSNKNNSNNEYKISVGRVIGNNNRNLLSMMNLRIRPNTRELDREEIYPIGTGDELKKIFLDIKTRGEKERREEREKKENEEYEKRKQEYEKKKKHECVML